MVALDRLAELARQDTQLVCEPAFPTSSLLVRLSRVPDRRKRRGRRHELVVVLVLVACATLVVGNNSVAAIWQWSAGTSQRFLKRIGARRDPLRGRYLVPSERTFRRVLADLDTDALDVATCGFAADVVRSAAPVHVVPRTPGPAGRGQDGVHPGRLAHHQKTARLITQELHAHYVLVLKGNQPSALKAACAVVP